MGNFALLALPVETVQRARAALSAVCTAPAAVADHLAEAAGALRELNTFSAMAKGTQEPRVLDGGCAWDYTIAGLTIYDGDGTTVATLRLRGGKYENLSREELARVALALAMTLGLVEVTP